MNNKLENLYRDRLPEEILQELTPEVRRQYFLWDEIMKREIELYPWLILLVIREIFHREYGNDENVQLLSTEYTLSRVHEGGEKLLHAIRSDILLKIRSDLYHFECQIEKDGKMVLRMMEYDVHIALVHGRKAEKDKNGSGEFEVAFPKWMVLYLGDEGAGVQPGEISKNYSGKHADIFLKEDAELYMEVSVEVEPAIKLSREIIQELREDNEGLKSNIQELHQELENACKKLIDREVCKGTGIEEIKKELMEIFTLTEKEAEEKIKAYRKER